jgi:hypothetical protein
MNASQLLWRGGVPALGQKAGSDRVVDEVRLVYILFDLQRLRTKQKDERGGRGKREREGSWAGRQVWAFGFGSGKILMTNWAAGGSGLK